MQQHDAGGLGRLRAEEAIFERGGINREKAVGLKRHALPSPSSCPGLTRASTSFFVRRKWMAGSSPAMTATNSRVTRERRSQLLTRPLAQLEALDLAGRSLRQGVNDLDPARIFPRPDLLLDVVLERLVQG